jgi:hypothetical protein
MPIVLTRPSSTFLSRKGNRLGSPRQMRLPGSRRLPESSQRPSIRRVVALPDVSLRTSANSASVDRSHCPGNCCALAGDVDASGVRSITLLSMCGRYVRRSDKQKIAEHFHVHGPSLPRLWAELECSALDIPAHRSAQPCHRRARDRPHAVGPGSLLDTVGEFRRSS